MIRLLWLDRAVHAVLLSVGILPSIEARIRRAAKKSRWWHPRNQAAAILRELALVTNRPAYTDAHRSELRMQAIQKDAGDDRLSEAEPMAVTLTHDELATALGLRRKRPKY